MEIKTYKSNNVTVLAVSGRIDSQTAPELSKLAKAALEGGASRLVFDFSKVDYTSSAGMRVILNTAKGARAQGGDLYLAGVQLPVEKVLSLAGFSSMIKMYPDVETAAGSFS